jgi:hypothetical protein
MAKLKRFPSYNNNEGGGLPINKYTLNIQPSRIATLNSLFEYIPIPPTSVVLAVTATLDSHDGSGIYPSGSPYFRLGGLFNFETPLDEFYEGFNDKTFSFLMNPSEIPLPGYVFSVNGGSFTVDPLTTMEVNIYYI